MREPKAYLAAPFFNPVQIALVEKLEIVIEEIGYRLFSPRQGNNAIEMNKLIKAQKEWDWGLENNPVASDIPRPELSEELRYAVFKDNVENIDDADIVIAVIDNFDVGVMFEIGLAFARHVPILTHTGAEYGCNLMLAHSIIGHTKTIEEVTEALNELRDGIALDSSTEDYGRVIATIQQRFKTKMALLEGPGERK